MCHHLIRLTEHNSICLVSHAHTCSHGLCVAVFAVCSWHHNTSFLHYQKEPNLDVLHQYLFPPYFHDFPLPLAELAGTQNQKEIKKTLIFLIARSSVWSSARESLLYFHSEGDLLLNEQIQ